jgi:hypothetical protein
MVGRAGSRQMGEDGPGVGDLRQGGGRATGGQTTDNGTGHEVSLKAGMTFHQAALEGVPCTSTEKWAR